MAIGCGLMKRHAATVTSIGPVEHIVGEPFIPEPLQSSHVVVVCSVIQSQAQPPRHDLGFVGSDFCWAVGPRVGVQKISGIDEGGSRGYRMEFDPG